MPPKLPQSLRMVSVVPGAVIIERIVVAGVSYIAWAIIDIDWATTD